MANQDTAVIGGVRYEAVNADISDHCAGCAADGVRGLCNRLPECVAWKREDGRTVSFVEARTEVPQPNSLQPTAYSLQPNPEAAP